MVAITKESIDAFIKIHATLDEKFEIIRKLPMLRKQEANYNGFELDTWNGTQGLVINSYWYYGCSEETSSIFIPISELHEPISFFEKKFQDEIDKENARQLQLRELEKARVKENREKAKKAEYQKYLQLKKKYDSAK